MEKSRNRKNKPDTAQKSIPFLTMYPDGICHVKENTYNCMIEFSDVNYELLGEDDRKDFQKKYKKVINYFDSEISIQMLLLNRRAGIKSLEQGMELHPVQDGHDALRRELAEVLKAASVQENKGIVRTRYYLLGIEAKDKKEAADRLKGIAEDVKENLSKLGVKSRRLNGTQRLKVLYEYFNQDTQMPFHFSYANAAACGHSVKDYIAPSVFDFRYSNRMKSGNMHGSMFYVAVLTENLEDDFLSKLTAVEANLTVSIHYNCMDPAKAAKFIKEMLSDVQKMKVDNQKDAVNKGYDMDVMPADIPAYEKDLLHQAGVLSASNQKVVWTTFLIGCFGRTRQEMEQGIQKIKGIVEQANCELRPLTNQQEDAFMSASPIGTNKISILRNLITDVIAILVPFKTQELHTGGEAVYYCKTALYP